LNRGRLPLVSAFTLPAATGVLRYVQVLLADRCSDSHGEVVEL